MMADDRQHSGKSFHLFQQMVGICIFSKNLTSHFVGRRQKLSWANFSIKTILLWRILSPTCLLQSKTIGIKYKEWFCRFFILFLIFKFFLVYKYQDWFCRWQTLVTWGQTCTTWLPWLMKWPNNMKRYSGENLTKPNQTKH